MGLVREKIGLLYGVFAPIVSEPADALPAYGARVDCGMQAKAALKVTTANATCYGDDALAIKADPFVSGELGIETLLHTLELDASLYGSAVSDGVSTDSDTDEPPLGGYGYIQKLMGADKVVFYRAVFLPKVQAQMSDDNADSKGDKLTFSNNPVKFAVMRCASGAWRKRKEFHGAGAEAAAKSWLETMFGGSATYYTVTVEKIGTGAATPLGISNVAAGQSLEISFGTTDPDALYADATLVTSAITSHKYTVTPTADTVIRAIFAAP